MSSDIQLGSEAHHVLKAMVQAFTSATKPVNLHFCNANSKHGQQTTGDQLHAMRKKLGSKGVTPVEFVDALEELFLDDAAKLNPIHPIARQMILSACQKLDNGGKGVFVNEYYCSVILYCADPMDIKLQTAFDAFDLNADGFISREEMHSFLSWLLGGTVRILADACNNPAAYAMNEENTTPIKNNMAAFEKIFSVERVPEMVSSAFDAADSNHDNLISFEEWKSWTAKGGLASQWGVIGDLFQ